MIFNLIVSTSGSTPTKLNISNFCNDGDQSLTSSEIMQSVMLKKKKQAEHNQDVLILKIKVF